jgi:sphinganine-1-phosphate aldolase
MVSVVAFSSTTVNIYALGDLMSKKGWHLSALANPPALHMAFTVSHSQSITTTGSLQLPSAGSVEKLIDGLAEGLAELKSSPQPEGDMVALYGESSRVRLEALEALADE